MLPQYNFKVLFSLGEQIGGKKETLERLYNNKNNFDFVRTAMIYHKGISLHSGTPGGIRLQEGQLELMDVCM